MRTERNEKGWLAWHTAALQRAKKMPKLADLMTEKKKKTSAPQTPEQMEAALKSFMASRHRKKKDGISSNRRSKG